MALSPDAKQALAREAEVLRRALPHLRLLAETAAWLVRCVELEAKSAEFLAREEEEETGEYATE